MPRRNGKAQSTGVDEAPAQNLRVSAFEDTGLHRRISTGRGVCMAQWIKVCEASEAPELGKVGQYDVQGVAVCLANIDGELSALDNLCPHRGGPLSEGWIEGNAVVCPWHAWAFDVTTGDCLEEHSQVPVFPVRREGGDVLVSIA